VELPEGKKDELARKNQHCNFQLCSHRHHRNRHHSQAKVQFEGEKMAKNQQYYAVVGICVGTTSVSLKVKQHIPPVLNRRGTVWAAEVVF
jgi:hypothetical protein